MQMAPSAKGSAVAASGSATSQPASPPNRLRERKVVGYDAIPPLFEPYCGNGPAGQDHRAAPGECNRRGAGHHRDRAVDRAKNIAAILQRRDVALLLAGRAELVARRRADRLKQRFSGSLVVQRKPIPTKGLRGLAGMSANGMVRPCSCPASD